MTENLNVNQGRSRGLKVVKSCS